MQFESFSAFLAMGGYGFYVWLSYGVSALLLAILYFSSKANNKAIKQQIKQKQKREDKLRQAAQQQQQLQQEHENNEVVS